MHSCKNVTFVYFNNFSLQLERLVRLITIGIELVEKTTLLPQLYCIKIDETMFVMKLISRMHKLIYFLEKYFFEFQIIKSILFPNIVHNHETRADILKGVITKDADYLII